MLYLYLKLETFFFKLKQNRLHLLSFLEEFHYILSYNQVCGRCGHSSYILLNMHSYHLKGFKHIYGRKKRLKK